MTRINLDIKQNFQHKMFFVKVNGGIAYLKYDQVEKKVMELNETYVPISSRKRGVATELVTFVMNYANAREYEVLPTFPFVKHFLKKNSKYQDIIIDKKQHLPHLD